MARDTAEPRQISRQESAPRRFFQKVVFGATLVFVLAALLVSAILVVYTAWLHDLGRGLFALIFAVLSAQIALNWLLWREDAAELDEDPSSYN